MSNELPIIPTETWNKIFWSFNLPLQMWANEDDDGSYIFLNYMARRGRCEELDEPVTKEELPQFCKNTAIILRNLAERFEMLAEGKIDNIYYPDETEV